MIKSDLQTGNVVEFANGRQALLINDKNKFIYLQDGAWECSLSDFNDDLMCVDDPDYNIIVVYEDYTLKRVLWERDEPSKKEKLRQLLKEILEEL